MEIVKAVYALLKETFHAWGRDRASRWAAALAFYTLFSMAPLLVLSLGVLGFFYGEEEAQAQIRFQVGAVAGNVGRQAVDLVFDNADASRESSLTLIVSGITLILGAMAIFAALQDALNVIWNVPPDPDASFLEVLKKRLVSFVVITFLGLLLVASTLLNALKAIINPFLSGFGSSTLPAIQVIDFVVTFVMITLVLALVFKVLPDVKLTWRDVWIGAVVTALLFGVGRLLIRLYLQTAPFSTTYGTAAGSLIPFLIWVYYSAQIIFFGAELTQVYANKHGSRLIPHSQHRRQSQVDRPARQAVSQSEP